MSRPTIVLTGAGSGGHITPLLAVAAELKKTSPETRLIYVGQQGDALGDIPVTDANIDAAYSVRAGKFRRYHGEGWRQWLDLQTLFLNARDAIYALVGLVQSWRLLRRLQPNVVFVKGGFVGVPVGLAAAALRIPYITHDSDAIPGLANRIIARWAARHAVALPEEVYRYSADKTVTTGIPLQEEFMSVTAQLQRQYRKEINIPETAELLFVIGGGLGAQRINNALADILPHLLRDRPRLQIVQVVGRTNEAAMNALYEEELPEPLRRRVQVFGYMSDVYRYSGAADLVITRAGATNLAEFEMQGKACIIIPSPFLTGGHQLKNAAVLADKGAAVLLSETELLEDANRLAKQVTALLNDDTARQRLATNLATFARPDAARRLAALILELARGKTQA